MSNKINLENIKNLIKYEFLYKVNYKKSYFKKIIKMYSNLVEYYDSIQDPIKIYFIERIQLYTSEYSLNLNKIKKNKLNIQNKEINFEKEIDQEMIKNYRINKINFENNKTVKIDYKKKIETKQNEYMNNLKIINKNLSDQEKNWELRLRKRKNISFNKSLKFDNEKVNNSFNWYKENNKLLFNNESDLNIIKEELDINNK